MVLTASVYGVAASFHSPPSHSSVTRIERFRFELELFSRPVDENWEVLWKLRYYFTNEYCTT
jgi:hypothetical protein